MVLFFIWYITCTRHKRVPLIISILILILSFIPMVGIFLFLLSFLMVVLGKDELGIELKDNWINRTFFAYHAE